MTTLTNTKRNQLNPESWNTEYRRILIQAAFNKVSDYQIAEDLVQETFMAAWKARDRFRGDCSEKTFLTGILRNKIIDFYRARGRRPTVLASQLDNPEDDAAWLDNKMDETVDDPTNEADKGDFMTQLNTAIDNLPGKMGEAFRLWKVQDLSTEEVTGRMGISTNNLWVLIHRAKKALSIELGQDWKGASFANS